MSAHEMKGAYRIFILIDTSPGQDEAVMQELLKYDEVFEIHVISGQYDLLAVAEISLYGKSIFSSIQEFSHRLVRKIRKLDGVQDTNTIVPFLSMTKRAK